MLLRRAIVGCTRRNEVLSRNLSITTSLNSNKNDEDPTKKAKTTAGNKAELYAARQKEAKAKLNALLESMSKDTKQVYPSESKLSLATPKIRMKTVKIKPVKSKIEPEMLEAVEKVSVVFTQEKEELNKNLIAKLESVAEESEKSRLEPFKPDKKKTDDLNSLLNTLKVEVKSQPKKKSPESRLSALKIESLYSGSPSGIFSKAEFKEESEVPPKLATWEKLYQRELEFAVTHPPANGFQQMIMWTKQGKLWRFPIDNEQGFEEEAKVGFHEHVFLEPHLKPWCPVRGPIRIFMDLVIIGLSKNPYLTVAQKKDHINWFRDFFEAKRSILVETGAIPDAPPAPALST